MLLVVVVGSCLLLFVVVGCCWLVVVVVGCGWLWFSSYLKTQHGQLHVLFRNASSMFTQLHIK